VRKESNIDKNFFAGVKFEDFGLAGGRIRFPVRCYDYSMIVAAFPAPAEKVQKVLPSNKMKPVEIMPDTAAVALVATEYGRIDDFAPYNEFVIMVSVMYEADNAPGLHGYYVLHQPVTTEEARGRGVEIYGYPKFKAEISFEDVAEIRRCHVRADGRDIITLEVKKLVTEPLSWDMYFYTVKSRQLLRSLVQGQGQQGVSGDREDASYTLGNHPIAEGLRALGMDKLSVLHRYAPHWQSMAHLPGEHLPL